MDAQAINFLQLLREEKRKKRQKESPKEKEKETDYQTETFSRVADVPTTAVAAAEWWRRLLSMDILDLKVVCDDPKTIFYSERVFSNERESLSITTRSSSPVQALEDWLNSIPSGDSGLREWKTMKYGKRRVCMFGEGKDAELPPPLYEIAQQLVDRRIFSEERRPNHVLLNEYQPGQGILPHTDGPLYSSRTATLSLISSVVVEFTKRLSPDEIGESGSNYPPISILLQPGSLLVFEDDAYINYCHSIAVDVLEDIVQHHCVNAAEGTVVERQKRFSLTFRHKRMQENFE